MEVKGLKIGTILKGKSHNYRVTEILGSGSFGITYLADVIFGKSTSASSLLKVTIKEFFMKDFNGRAGSVVTIGSRDGHFSKYLHKFNQEADKLSMVKSDGVVKVLELFHANNTSYYVMQYLSGGSLNDLISDRKIIPQRYALQLGLQIANALKDIHEKKMLHLDLKPSNVMLSGVGNAVLIDFGLSKQYNENGEPETSTSIGGGTRGYAPVEQAQYHDGHDFPATMDIYALGGTLFKMLSGVVPPDSSSILNDGFPKGILIQAGVSPVVASYVEKLMSPMKKDRPQNMHQVISGILSLGSRVNIVDKKELSKWIIGTSPSQNINHEVKDNEESVIHSDIDTKLDSDIEVVSVNRGGFESKKVAAFDSAIDKLEIKVILDSNKNSDYNWFSITATPTQLVLINSRKGEQQTHKKTFFYSGEKFLNLKNQLQSLNLRCDKNDVNGVKPLFGISVETYKGGRTDFYAATYEDSASSGILTGDIDSLTALAWGESGLISLDSLSGKKRKFAKVTDFITSPRKWIGYPAIFFVVIFFWVISEPIENFIDHEYRNEIVSSWKVKETSNYRLRATQGGRGGVFYTPANTWAISPEYTRSNSEAVYISDDSFTLPGVKILAQQDEFALITIKDRINLFYKGAPISND